MQVDSADRGFSFMHDGPLDMRMGNDGISAKEFIASASEEEIANVIYKYGEEVQSRQIASSIVKMRAIEPIETTLQLADIVRNAMHYRKSKIDPATKTFQALRIFLNDEINNLKIGLEKSKDLIKTGGRIVCISFHSLEDRAVKKLFAPKKISYPKEVPLNNEVIREFRVVAKKIKPKSSELEINKRSRSAIMRVFEKI